MENIIKLLPASALSDIECKDGEVENAVFPSGDSSSSSSSSSYSFRFSESATPPSPVSLPAMATFLCMHHPPGVDAPHAVALLPDGTLVFSSTRASSPVRAVVAVPVAWLPVSSVAVKGVVKAVAVGEWLVILTDSALLYALWSDGTYVWYGESSSLLTAEFTPLSRALPPYSNVDSDFPVLSVSVGIGGDTSSAVLDWLAGNSSVCSLATRRNILNAVGTAVEGFLVAVKKAGLYFSPVKAAACLRLSDGTLWLQSAPVYVSSVSVSESPGVSSPLSLRITAAGCSDGSLFMNLRLSRRPFEVSSSVEEGSSVAGFPGAEVEAVRMGDISDVDPSYVSDPLRLEDASRGFRVGAIAIKEDDYGSIPGVCNAFAAGGLPDDIFSIGGRLFGVRRSETTLGANIVTASSALFPQIAAGVSRISGGSIIHLTRSLRSSSSGASLEFPLLAFASDGIRLLSPSGSEYRESQLISRDVAVGKNSFAPLAEGTCFVTASGVKMVKGTSVSLLHDPSPGDFDSRDRLIFLYRSSLLLLYRPGVSGIKVYDFISGKWGSSGFSIVSHHYAWPEVWVVSGSRLGILENGDDDDVAALSGGISVADSDSLPVAVKTRPIKLGSPFTLKQLEWIEGVWPDGSRWPVKVYGALKLGRWHFLGCATKGCMRMRGSGWRFFIIETFVPHVDGKYQFPVFRLLTKNC